MKLMVAHRIDYERIEVAEEELPALRELTNLISGAGAGELRLSRAAGDELSLPSSAVKLLQLGKDMLD